MKVKASLLLSRLVVGVVKPRVGHRTNMALPFDVDTRAHDSRTLSILAKTIYRELRAEGYGASQVMALAGELLGLVAGEVKDRRAPSSQPESPHAESSVEAQP